MLCTTIMGTLIAMQAMAVEPIKTLPPPAPKTTPTQPLTATPQKITPATVPSSPVTPQKIAPPAKVEAEAPKPLPALPNVPPEEGAAPPPDTAPTPWITPPAITNWLTLQPKSTPAAWKTNAPPPAPAWNILPTPPSAWDTKPAPKPTPWK